MALKSDKSERNENASNPFNDKGFFEGTNALVLKKINCRKIEIVSSIVKNSGKDELIFLFQKHRYFQLGASCFNFL